ATDCDDFDHAVNPGALEICADGIDNNCNNVVDTDCAPIEFREWDRIRNWDELRTVSPTLRVRLLGEKNYP
ncbi:MAG: hypothetical protein GWP58_11850, partial [Gammaproteobacteria bacterium]|nr:hypothetical protein [Gammaproteobacteria bacterium]